MTAADRRCSLWALLPDKETLTRFWNCNSGRESRGCLTHEALGPTQVQQKAGCPTCGSGHRAWELTWIPLYTGQPLQSSLFSLNSTIPKNK